MGSIKFGLNIGLRVAAIALTMFGGIWSYFQTDFIVSPIGFGVITIAQLVALSVFITNSRNELLKFFRGIDFRDFSKNYQESSVGSADELKVEFNRVLNTFRSLTLEKEEQYQYLQLVNREAPIGILSFDENGKIDLYNPELAKLLNSPVLGQLDQLEKYEAEFFDWLNKQDSDNWIFESKGNARKLAVKRRRFELAERPLVLITVLDISSELDASEIDAFQKLIRVLTHEIMNSVTPVVSLTTAMRLMLQEGDDVRESALSADELKDLYKSTLAIEKRGEGLMAFVKAYRNYTKPIELERTEANIGVLLENVIQLCRTDLEGVQLQFVKGNTNKLQLDEKLISQVLINLIKNAREALSTTNEPSINIELTQTSGLTKISISDNGPGIPEDIRKDIFVPFFTTKKEGSGIGLSLSRQIVKAHGGELSLKSSVQGSEFVIAL